MSDLLVFPGGGRLRSVDKRDLDHLLPPPRSAPGTPTTKIYQHWRAPQALDQGKTSSCVGHGCHHLLLCSPIRNIKNIPDPYQIYNEAQKIDEWAGENYDGTSVRAGIKVLVRHGFIESYKWAFDGPTAVNHILNVGPVVTGTDWTTGMMSADEKGFIYPEGKEVGGHCVIWVGANSQEKCPDGNIGSVTCLNSWGPNWSRKGRAKLSMKAFDDLIRANGEAAAVFEKLKPQEPLVVS